VIRSAGRGTRASAFPDPGEHDRGQATVELALVLPLFFALLVLLFQVALVARDEVLVIHAARVAVREASVTDDRRQIASTADRSLPGGRVRVLRRGPVGDMVEVEVVYVSPTDLPIVGALLPDVTLRAHAVMRVER
jgi:TadE-like protein